MLAAFGMGGYSPALFMLFTGVVPGRAVLPRRRQPRARLTAAATLADCGGGTAAHAAHHAGARRLGGGHQRPHAQHVQRALGDVPRRAARSAGTSAALPRWSSRLAVLATIGAHRAVRLPRVLRGGDRRAAAAPWLRRRPAARGRRAPARTALVALAGAAAATLVGLPGLSSFTLGSREVPGLTFSHFVFYGRVRQQLALRRASPSPSSSSSGAGGAAAAWWLFAAAASPPAATGRASASPGPATAARRPHPGRARCAAALPRGFVAGRRRCWTPSTSSCWTRSRPRWGRASAPSARLLTRLRTAGIGVSLAAAFAVVARSCWRPRSSPSPAISR